MIQRFKVTVPAAGNDLQIRCAGSILVVEQSPATGADDPLLFIGGRTGDGLRAETLARYGTCAPFSTVWVKGTVESAGETLRFFTGSSWCYRGLVPQPVGSGGSASPQIVGVAARSTTNDSAISFFDKDLSVTDTIAVDTNRLRHIAVNKDRTFAIAYNTEAKVIDLSTGLTVATGPTNENESANRVVYNPVNDRFYYSIGRDNRIYEVTIDDASNINFSLWIDSAIANFPTRIKIDPQNNRIVRSNGLGNSTNPNTTTVIDIETKQETLIRQVNDGGSGFESDFSPFYNDFVYGGGRLFLMADDSRIVDEIDSSSTNWYMGRENDEVWRANANDQIQRYVDNVEVATVLSSNLVRAIGPLY